MKMHPQFNIHSDIRQANTLPGNFYNNESVYQASKEKIFARTWQYAADASDVAEPMDTFPFILLKNYINEPLVFTRDKEGITRCLSNVCTHRGKIIVEKPGKGRMLTCGYHGRCFRLDGSFKSMPEFEQVAGFPSEQDHLSKIPMGEFSNLLFVSPEPNDSFENYFRPMIDRVGWLPLHELKFSAEHSRDYFIDAHWALYCDNYLEGFHIPFVHPALNDALDFEKYEYEIFDYCNLQLGIADEGTAYFDIPEGAPYYGQKVYAYYFFLFPNMMFNFYPWGLSLNVVQPLAVDKTKISFRTYLYNNSATPDIPTIHQTEMEDEAVVESVQIGLQSRYYKHGRFSPTMEQGVHHFHSLISQFLK